MILVNVQIYEKSLFVISFDAYFFLFASYWGSYLKTREETLKPLKSVLFGFMVFRFAEKPPLQTPFLIP